MDRRFDAISLIFLVVAVFAVEPSALADGKDVAREQYRIGTAFYDVGEFQQALEAFKKAYLNYEDPAFLYNMAQCYRQMGAKEDAVRSYRSYLRRMPNAPNATEVRQFIASLEQIIGQSPSPTPTASKLDPEPHAAQQETTPAVQAVARAAETPPARPPRLPIYKRWWLWTTLGVVVAGAAVGLGLGLTLGSSHSFNPTLSGFSANQTLMMR